MFSRSGSMTLRARGLGMSPRAVVTQRPESRTRGDDIPRAPLPQFPGKGRPCRSRPRSSERAGWGGRTARVWGQTLLDPLGVRVANLLRPKDCSPGWAGVRLWISSGLDISFVGVVAGRRLPLFSVVPKSARQQLTPGWIYRPTGDMRASLVRAGPSRDLDGCEFGVAGATPNSHPLEPSPTGATGRELHGRPLACPLTVGRTLAPYSAST